MIALYSEGIHISYIPYVKWFTGTKVSLHAWAIQRKWRRRKRFIYLFIYCAFYLWDPGVHWPRRSTVSWQEPQGDLLECWEAQYDGWSALKASHSYLMGVGSDQVTSRRTENNNSAQKVAFITWFLPYVSRKCWGTKNFIVLYDNWIERNRPNWTELITIIKALLNVLLIFIHPEGSHPLKYIAVVVEP